MQADTLSRRTITFVNITHAFDQFVPLLLGLVLTMAAINGQVVINDAMVARYVPPQLRAKAFSVRYFLGFTAAGMAVPMIALLHEAGGSPHSRSGRS